MLCSRKPLYLMVALATSSLATANTPEDAGNEKSDLGNIRVTGQKIERSLQDTTSGVSVINNEMIEKNAGLELDQILGLSSNVRIYSTSEASSFSIRGIQASGNPGEVTTSGDAATIVVDGAYFEPDYVSAGIPVWDIKNVEILKGPQSTSLGKNALAGAIIINSNDPEFYDEGSVRLGYGSHNTQVSSLMYNKALSDNLAVRFAGERTYTDGQIENVYKDDDKHAAEENMNGRVKVLYKPTNALDIKFTAAMTNFTKGDDRTCGGNHANTSQNCSLGDYKVSVDETPEIEYKNQNQTLDIGYQLNSNLLLQSITSHAVRDQKSDLDADLLSPDNSDYTGADKLGVRHEEEKDTSISQEFRVTFKNDFLTSTTGVFYSESKESQKYDFKLANVLDAYLPSFTAAFGLSENDAILETQYKEEDQRTKFTNYAVFNETDISLTSSTVLTAGIRYEKETSETGNDISATNLNSLANLNDEAGLYFSSPAAAAYLPLLQAYGIDPTVTPWVEGGLELDMLLGQLAAQSSINDTDSKASEVVLPKLGIRHNFTDDIMMGYTISRGYRSGGVSLNPTGTETVVEYDPEFVTNHELALRSQFLERALTVNMNLYRLDWEDQQVGVFGSSGSFYDRYVANAGKSNLSGGELDISYRMNMGLYTFANLAHAQTEFDDFETNGNDYSGNEFAYSPDYTRTLGLGFDQGLGVNAQLTYIYTGKAYENAANTVERRPYTITNLNIGYKAVSWKASLYVNNVFNVNATTSKYEVDESDFVIYSDRYRIVPERSFGLIVQYDF